MEHKPPRERAMPGLGREGNTKVSPGRLQHTYGYPRQATWAYLHRGNLCRGNLHNLHRGNVHSTLVRVVGWGNPREELVGLVGPSDSESRDEE